MAHSIEVKFDQPILIENWEKLCVSSGGSFCDSIVGQNVYAFRNKVEVKLNAEGTVGPPPVFTGLRISTFNDDPEFALHLLSRIATFPGGSVTHYDALFADHLKASARFLDDTRTVKQTKSAFGDVQNRMLLANIKSDVSDAMLHSLHNKGQKNTETTRDEIRGELEGILSGASNALALSDYEVDDATVCTVTWKDLYPKFIRRTVVRTLIRIFKVKTRIHGPLSLFQTLMGYKTESRIMVDEERIAPMLDELTAGLDINEFIAESMEIGALSIANLSTLDIPYSYINSSIRIVPRNAVEHINLKLKVSDKGLEA